MLLISFWQVLMFLIVFLSLKQAKNEGELGIVHGKARLKLNYTNNPSLGELRSLCQINQVCKEENQRRNLTFNNFPTPCEMPKKEFCKPCETKDEENEFRTLCEILQALRKSSCVIFRYFCTDSVRFLSQDILCNYLFSPCNKLKIFLDI